MAEALGAQQSPTLPPTVERLRSSPGPRWQIVTSSRFRVHVEEVPFLTGRSRLLVDSLEAAWSRAAQLVGGVDRRGGIVSVFVTGSRTPFPEYLRPHNRGLTTMSETEEDLVILVHNDSVRSYTAHEVMHIVARRAWGPRLGHPWLQEGLATFADGQCQATTIYPVARDYLQRQPLMSLEDVRRRFQHLLAADRALAYALAGTVVGYVVNVAGIEGLRRVWLSRDPPTQVHLELQGANTTEGPTRQSRPTMFGDDPSTGWRDHVNTTAGHRAGLSLAQLRRFGCG